MIPNALREALATSAGARFFRCALQVNPFTYLERQNKPLPDGCNDEDSYNRTIIDALVEAGVEVIAVTDHHRITSARHLLAAASAAGLTALPGFEACTKDNVHILVLFDSDRDLDEIDRCLGRLGVRPETTKTDAAISTPWSCWRRSTTGALSPSQRTPFGAMAS
jgi:hypothetical protein